MSKYGNIRTVIDNISFASKAEAARYCELKLLLRAKQIKDLRLQPRFLLQVEFTDMEGIKHKKMEYIADFQYKEFAKGRRGYQSVVEDVKGMTTEVYKLKKKLFLFLYPKLVFKEIK